MAVVVVEVAAEAVAELAGTVVGGGAMSGPSPRPDLCPSSYQRRSCPPRCSHAPGGSIGLQGHVFCDGLFVIRG